MPGSQPPPSILLVSWLFLLCLTPSCYWQRKGNCDQKGDSGGPFWESPKEVIPDQFRLGFLCYVFIFHLFSSPFLGIKFTSMSLHQDISYSFEACVSIIWCVPCSVSTRIGFIMKPSYTKSNSGLTAVAILLAVRNDKYSCFGSIVVYHRSETFPVTVGA